MKTKRLLLVLLLIIIATFGTSTSAFAASSIDYTLFLTNDGHAYKAASTIDNYSPYYSPGEEITLGEGNFKGLTWNNDDSAWIMNNFSFKSTATVGVHCEGNVNIKIVGTVNISGKDFGMHNVGTTVIYGTGTLNIKNTSAGSFSAYEDAVKPSALYTTNALKITDANINATGFCGGIDGNPITVSGDSVVKATGTNAALLSFGGPVDSTDKKIYGNVKYNCFKDMTATESIKNTDYVALENYSTSYYFLKLKKNGKLAKSVTMISSDRYMVSVDSGIKNGNVTVSKKSTKAKETITVKPVASKGYKIDKVYYNDGTKHVIKPVNGKYTFKMPESDVVVSATFVKKETSGGSNDQKDSKGNGGKTDTDKTDNNKTGTDKTDTDNAGSSDNNTTGTNIDGSPQTGDSANPMAMAALMVLSMAGMATAVLFRRREQ